MSDLAHQLARTIFIGFERHFSFFQEITRAARHGFENADWESVKTASQERIGFYDKRVAEAIRKLRTTFDVERFDEALWQRVKTIYQGFLQDYRRPELAETFYNSVFCQLFHRQYYKNDKIFIESGVDKRALARKHRSYLSFHVKDGGFATCIEELLTAFYFRLPFESLEQDIEAISHAFRERSTLATAPDHALRIDVLESPFYRNKAAYLIGRVVHEARMQPLIIPLLNEDGALRVDTLLTQQEQAEALFSFARAYFMVNASVPAAFVDFLQSIMPNKPQAELYMSIGFHKQAKNEFYRHLLRHLKNSKDTFSIAPGTPGLVMLVFTLPSFPFVFKVIRDKFAPQKNITHDKVKQRYMQVKLHDRVGRMADTLEFSNTSFPIARFSPELLAELKSAVPSLLELDGDQLIIKHLYIENRMTPLDVHLKQINPEERRVALAEWGQAVKQLMAADLFAGDLLFKNFGLTQQGKVVFYDYDEICTMTECNFRRIPEPRTYEEEMASEPWYSIADNDVFPEEFLTFLTADRQARKILREEHPELFDYRYWQQIQQQIQQGHQPDVFPYPRSLRFGRAAQAEFG